MTDLTPAEQGMLLLCSSLGDSQAAPLTPAQFRELFRRVLSSAADPASPLGHVTDKTLLDLGYERDFAARVVALLERQQTLEQFLTSCRLRKLTVLTRISPGYPRKLLHMGQQAPAVMLFAGDLSLLDADICALTGSRDLEESGSLFARRVGRFCALEQRVLVTGGARGADNTAALTCLEAGGRVILFPAVSMLETMKTYEHFFQEGRMLIAAEGSPSALFTAARASLRNQLIYRTSDRAFIAQCGLRTGGTWSGAAEALKKGWAPIFANKEGGPGCRELGKRGAALVDPNYLQNYICRQVCWD